MRPSILTASVGLVVAIIFVSLYFLRGDASVHSRDASQRKGNDEDARLQREEEAWHTAGERTEVLASHPTVRVQVVDEERVPIEEADVVIFDDLQSPQIFDSKITLSDGTCRFRLADKYTQVPLWLLASANDGCPTLVSLEPQDRNELVTVVVERFRELLIAVKSLSGCQLSETTIEVTSRRAWGWSTGNSTDHEGRFGYTIRDVLAPVPEVRNVDSAYSVMLSPSLPYLLRISAYGHLPFELNIEPFGVETQKTVQADLVPVVLAAILKPTYAEDWSIVRGATLRVSVGETRNADFDTLTPIPPQVASRISDRLSDVVGVPAASIWWRWAALYNPSLYPRETYVKISQEPEDEPRRELIQFKYPWEFTNQDLLIVVEPETKLESGDLRIEFVGKDGVPHLPKPGWIVAKRGTGPALRRAVFVGSDKASNSLSMRPGHYVIESTTRDTRFGISVPPQFERVEIQIDRSQQQLVKIPLDSSSARSRRLTVKAIDSAGRLIDRWEAFVMKGGEFQAWREDVKAGKLETSLSPGSYKVFVIAFGFKLSGKFVKVEETSAPQEIVIPLSESDSGLPEMTQEWWIGEINVLSALDD